MIADRVTWWCQQCREPVGDGDGYLHVDVGRASRIVVAQRKWQRDHTEQVFSLAQLRQVPRVAQWRVHHRLCDPRPESDDYWIGVERVRTPAQLLRWTLHLQEKNWYAGADWSGLMRGTDVVQAAMSL